MKEADGRAAGPAVSGEDGVLVLVRPSGELAIKSRRTRSRFQRRLVENIRDALRTADLEFDIRGERGRIFVSASDRTALDLLTRVFGIVSISEVEATAEPALQQILDVGREVYAERVTGRTFAVRGRRAGRHPFTSRDINYGLGSELDRFGTVDLDHPEVTVHVEVREEGVYFFSRRSPAAGGLPLGVEGRAVALLSGGFDSAVAAWMMLRRSVELDYVFCNIGGAAYERAVLGVAKTLADDWSYGTRPRIHVVDFETLLETMTEKVEPRFWQLVLKRQMYRTAARIALELNADAIVTGESMGQVSSQTLRNLRALDGSVDLPVLRPLVGFDKEEIIERSRHIGTYPLSEKVREYCALVPQRPATAAPPEIVAAQEGRLDPSRLAAAVEGRKVLDLCSLSTGDLVMPYLYVSEIPRGARVIDTRSEARYRAWHYPSAEHREYWDLYRNYKKLDRDPTYILYCETGLKTAHLAERMQREGYQAYSVRGGAAALGRNLE